jgi:hypothetical protein
MLFEVLLLLLLAPLRDPVHPLLLLSQLQHVPEHASKLPRQTLPP